MCRSSVTTVALCTLQLVRHGYMPQSMGAHLLQQDSACTMNVLPEWRSLLCAAEKRTDFTARNLANFLWGLAKIEHHPGEQMLTDLATEIARKIDGANAQNLVSMQACLLTCPILINTLVLCHDDLHHQCQLRHGAAI